MNRKSWCTAGALTAALFLATSAIAQTRTSAVVLRPSAVLDAPRGDARVIDQVQIGTELDVIGKAGDWYLVTAPPTATAAFTWKQGWIPTNVLVSGGSPAPAHGRFMVRAFGRAGGTLFSASDSFDTILGRRVNSVYGGGGQIVLPNGAFVEAAIERFRHDGTLALGLGNQVFRLTTPTRLTLTPVQITAGFRTENSPRVASYFGAGAGWYTLEEESPFTAGANAIRKRSPGYHVLGGVELNVVRWMWVAGELQWATVPKALGDTGVSAIFEEKDLGGTTFCVKLIVGS